MDITKIEREAPAWAAFWNPVIGGKYFGYKDGIGVYGNAKETVGITRKDVQYWEAERESIPVNTIVPNE